MREAKARMTNGGCAHGAMTEKMVVVRLGVGRALSLALALQCFTVHHGNARFSNSQLT